MELNRFKLRKANAIDYFTLLRSVLFTTTIFAKPLADLICRQHSIFWWNAKAPKAEGSVDFAKTFYLSLSFFLSLFTFVERKHVIGSSEVSESFLPALGEPTFKFASLKTNACSFHKIFLFTEFFKFRNSFFNAASHRRRRARERPW